MWLENASDRTWECAGDFKLTKPSKEGVRDWEDQVVIPTYPVEAPDKNPMFLEKRVYQGSSGSIYPNAFTDRISNERVDRSYRAIFLENEYIRLMILPEIGGRIHIGLDKTNGYDFFYRQNVIKPALVGLLGPWISGGVEFNWPQHHRPSTYMPVQHKVEHHDDGSITVWLNEHDPMQRMKGMLGICLHPGRSCIEAKVRLFNRTPFVQTFLWWANVAVRVHDEYQAFFPPDVSYVADHAKRAISSFPIARDFYYGVDYRKKVDISWYKNIPVPTSYMVTESKYDFFGGYDHKRKAGLVHVANHHIVPGKKLWTWGNAEFGYAWDRNLTDSDGPYVELMAGVYTDNQPDFSWLHPYETRTWSQFWYPIQEIGPANNANRYAAVNLEQEGSELKIGVCVTEPFPGARIIITANGKPVFEEQDNLAPGKPFVGTFSVEGDPAMSLVAKNGREIISYEPEKSQMHSSPLAPASEPPAPKNIASSDELYITGVHLEQYRHATRHPEPYWEEALRRDPMDSRCNTAMGVLKLRRGEFTEAVLYLRRAVQRLTLRNPNPENSEAHYYLGIALQYQGKLEEAYKAYYKAIWNYAWQSSGYYRLAQIDCCRNQLDAALEHLEHSLATNRDNLNSRNLKGTVLRRLGRREEAEVWVRETIRMDPLNLWSDNELSLLSKCEQKCTEQPSLALAKGNVQIQLDIAFDYAGAGHWIDAIDILSGIFSIGDAVPPMVLYALGDFATYAGDEAKAAEYRAAAANASPDYCFPARIEEMNVLKGALAANPADAKAHYYLGNLLYDKKRYEEAICEWEASVNLDSSFSIPWRNLGIAYFNVRKDAQRALSAYEKSFSLNPGDARLLYELDQLRKRMGVPAAQRLAILEQHPDLVAHRDDLTVEVITVLNESGQSEKALDMLSSRRFNPWEGGEGLVSGQYVWAHLIIGRSRLESGQPEEALAHFLAARNYPRNLGEGKHLLTPEAHLDYFTSVALSQLGRQEEGMQYLNRVFADEDRISWMSYYQALSYQALGRHTAAKRTLKGMRSFAEKQMSAEIKVEYFATSLPDFLLFEDDLHKKNQVNCLFMVALADLAEGKTRRASELFKEILSIDANHLGAQVELRSLSGLSGERGAQPFNRIGAPLR